MIDLQELKQYFLPGDIVTLKKDIPNKPTMIVIKKVVSKLSLDKSKPVTDYFQGMLCRWFTTSGELQESVWNTKDIKLLKE
mgnify:CR=1 FL=1